MSSALLGASGSGRSRLPSRGRWLRRPFTQHCRRPVALAAVKQTLEVSYTTEELPPPHVGPIQVTTVPGKGRGVVTTRVVQAGELLMVDVPIGILRHPQRLAGSVKPLSAEDLAEHMLASRYTQPQLRALEALYDGSEQSGADAEALADLQRMLYAAPEREAEDQGDQSAPASSSTSPAGGPMRPSTQGGRAPIRLPKRKVQSIVELNAWGLPGEDTAACRCRGQASYAHIGVWPLFSMVNHSCAPNASPMVLGNRMLLRAAMPIPLGAEVCINYAGMIALSPLEVRQGMLERNHRFQCRCQRCTLEQRLASYVGDIWLTVFEAVVRQVQPRVKAAVEQGDMSSAEAALQQLYSYTVLTDDIMTQLTKELKLSRQAEMLLRASLYVVPENLENMDVYLQQGGALPSNSPRPNLESLADCVRLCSLVCGGSDLHVNLAVRFLSRARERWGSGHQRSQAAQKQLVRAFTARYGSVAPADLQRLLLASQAPGSKPLLLRT